MLRTDFWLSRAVVDEIVTLFSSDVVSASLDNSPCLFSVSPESIELSGGESSKVYFFPQISSKQLKIRTNRQGRIGLRGSREIFPRTSLEMSGKRVVEFPQIEGNFYIVCPGYDW